MAGVRTELLGLLVDARFATDRTLLGAAMSCTVRHTLLEAQCCWISREISNPSWRVLAGSYTLAFYRVHLVPVLTLSSRPPQSFDSRSRDFAPCNLHIYVLPHSPPSSRAVSARLMVIFVFDSKPGKVKERVTLCHCYLYPLVLDVLEEFGSYQHSVSSGTCPLCTFHNFRAG